MSWVIGYNNGITIVVSDFIELEKLYLQENQKENENSKAKDKEKLHLSNTQIKDPSESDKEIPEKLSELNRNFDLKYIIHFTKIVLK